MTAGKTRADGRPCAFPETVLLTGATGFLGTWVARELLQSTQARVVALVRPGDGRDAPTRLAAWWDEWPELAREVGGRVEVVSGDISDGLLGLGAVGYDSLAARVDAVVHCAAEVGIHASREHLWRVNVDGARNVARLAARARGLGRCGRFVHVSTAYVAGARTGRVLESDLTDEFGFNSLYEQSKYEAEVAVREVLGEAGVDLAVLRPAQIVGDSRTGEITTFNTLYYPLKLYLRGSVRAMPVAGGQRMSMVPVDHVARAAVRALRPDAPLDAGGCTVFHLVAPPDRQPTARQLAQGARAWAREELGVRLARPVFFRLPGAAALGRARNMADDGRPKRKSLLSNIAALAPYFSEDRVYDDANARALMGQQPPDWRDYLPKLLSYAVERGFLNHTGRTVFEQMLVRMRSSSAPITYYDVVGDEIVPVPGPDLARDAERAARALVRLGVGRGDRVAYVSVNSTRCLVVDAAIGLVGAASVPIYYTSPASDVVDLVGQSRARLLFVGTGSLAAKLAESSDSPDSPGSPGAAGKPGLPGTKVVSMLRDDAPDPASPLMAWDAFLALGDAPLDPEGEGRLEPPSPDDVATIRYTSGTTGRPKGVTFTQRQLRWMGRTMPALLDWTTRNRTLSYLSFLPNSHVVEGILITYAPYYALTDCRQYFLADFPRLAGTLPRVRPTIFFSVPRFYEKVWEGFRATGVGGYYLGLRDGVWKRLVGRVAARGLLAKAGLDRCRQLIVGSAPPDPSLLRSLRELGIEVHNAYGVTEAPLVALNRFGRNDLDGVGELLPQTEVRFGAEGEVWVRGPQVTSAYDGGGPSGTAPQPALDGDGWFATGDLGHLSENGRLVLDGRKKELIVTAYGKNVSPSKVEARLKGIAGVGEAMLVGDGRPFCTALLWPDAGLGGQGGQAAPPDPGELDRAVLEVNEGLSHPEQVKRWALLRDPPTIGGGELTPNLKLRRGSVLEARAWAVEALYDPSRADGDDRILHLGMQP